MGWLCENKVTATGISGKMREIGQGSKAQRYLRNPTSCFLIKKVSLGFKIKCGEMVFFRLFEEARGEMHVNVVTTKPRGRYT